VYSALIITYIASQLVPNIYLSYLTGALAVISILIAVKKAAGLYLITGLIFISLGGIFFIASDSPLHTFFLHFDAMLGLLSLFFMLPFLNSLIHVGHFDTQLNRLLSLKTENMKQLYKKSSFVTHILGMFLNVAMIPLLVRSLHKSLASFPDPIRNEIYSANLLRSYALALSWSPFEVLVSVIIDSTGLAYYQLAPITFLIMIFLILFDWKLFSSKSYSRSTFVIDKEEANKSRIKKKILQLAILLVSFIAVVTLVDEVIDHGYLFSVVLTIIPFSLLFCVMLRKTRRYLQITLPHWKERTSNLSNYMFLFLSAGFFVDMAIQTKEFGYIQTFIISNAGQPFLLYCIIGGYFLLTAMAGFHPLISLTLLVSILAPVIDQMASLPLSIVLIAASTATVMYSPFNVSVSLLSTELKINPYKITRWNIGYSLIYIAVGILSAYLITALFPV
jgi:hypothetical protein